jgi:zinc-ribbon domain
MRRPALRKEKAPATEKVPTEKARAADGDGSAELRAQRDRLLEKFTIMQADLGGAFYEMAIRNHVRMDVLTRKAAELQRVDAELLAIERMLELQEVDAAGLCPSCGSPYGPAVRFCPQCGHSLVAAEMEAAT